MKKYLITVTSIMLLCVGTIRAQNTLKQGDALAEQGNYKAAAQIYNQCIESDKQCLFKLCDLVFKEKVTTDYYINRLYDLTKPLALNGNTKAQYCLGVMYEYGYGVSKDYKEAAKWLRRSAERGNAYAQYRLGLKGLNYCLVNALSDRLTDNATIFSSRRNVHNKKDKR